MKASNLLKAKGQFLIAFVICSVTLFGCSDGGKHNKKILKDANGLYYQLRWSIGDVYFIDELKDYKKF